MTHFECGIVPLETPNSCKWTDLRERGAGVPSTHAQACLEAASGRRRLRVAGAVRRVCAVAAVDGGAAPRVAPGAHPAALRRLRGAAREVLAPRAHAARF